MTEWLAYLATGAIVGFAAGLLGIGGGVVMVPLLVWTFTSHGLPTEHVVHLAIGTALAAMVFTSIASMRSPSSLRGMSTESVPRVYRMPDCFSSPLKYVAKLSRED